MIFPLLEACGLGYNEQPYGEKGSQVVWPDFELLMDEPKVIGENKSLNKVDKGLSELRDYLDRKSIGADYGILTDGFDWILIKIELGGDVTEYPEISSIDLRPAIVEVAREEGVMGSAGIEDTDIDEITEEFTSTYEREQFIELITETAPRTIRDERKRDVDEFFELYIELLFGESEKHDYETSLMDDIHSPDKATETDERLFAVTLVNRLLFIKFLESRDVLEDGFLKTRVEQYQESQSILAGNLYETQIKPIFYKLFNTDKPDREPKFRQEGGVEWAQSVPYLNGGLFRENVPSESDYTVNDRILPTVVSDLIEGSQLSLSSDGFDPALLGSVFEKTINYIEQDRDQKDLGAYYTPNDVTDLINSEAIDPKAKEILVDTFASEITDDDEEDRIVRSNMEDMDLSEILREVEEGMGWFGSADAAETAIEELTELKIIDPACGSGHFLTSAMDEITRIQVSLLRGLNRGDDPSPEQKYELKRDLALNTIYGVDVDRVATEIAKLRVWLKIIEGNSWEPDFGPLPNIDINIAAGNSLVGLPVKGTVESASIWNDDISELAEKRRAYKFDREGSPEEIEALMQDIRPDFDSAYLDRYNKPIKTELEDVETFNEIYEGIETATLYPTLESVKIQQEDGSAFTDEQIERLEDLGCTTYKKSARMDIQDRESELKNAGRSNVKEHVADELRSLLQDGFVFDEFTRLPLQYDLERILGQPFHWPVEFPEVAKEGAGAERSIHFDIILGNPPYGDLLNDNEKLFTSTYKTSSIREISAQFVERQFQLLGEDGYFGNITTLRLVFQSNYDEFHDLLRKNLSPTRISCFGLRGRTGVFANALIRVGVFSGKKSAEDRGDIYTSDLVLFTEDNRQQRFENIELSSTKDLVLRDKIGGEGSRGPVLPKIGPQTKRGLLEILREQSDTQMENVFERKDPVTTDHPVILTESGGYWINPMIEALTDKAGHRYLYFDTELEQQTAFLVYSSSLYYSYWITYGDQRHHTLGEMAVFPWPDEEQIEKYEDEIETLASTLWDRMQDNFTGTSFQMSPLRQIIDDVDRLVGTLYNLNDEHIDYTMKYHTDIGEQSGREGDPDASSTYESLFE
ncbi:Eco57I restriction-modification methylase domain-containing protein [Haloparvum sedimenti]|uniref:Eco57I restriction-modification methylase domain-containing protein n=1 Tax=Haloparvum sedimenti TaxID=1678448 RepID=UPI000F7A0A7E|nr:DNA methyltransferase [Haloparvum sedimenti]